jgi:hypothetical protein
MFDYDPFEMIRQINETIASSPTVRQHDYELADIRPGRIFERQYRDVTETFEVEDFPFQNEAGEWKVNTRHINDNNGLRDKIEYLSKLIGETDTSRYLSDMGVVPYSGGTWNECKLTLLNPEDEIQTLDS